MAKPHPSAGPQSDHEMLLDEIIAEVSERMRCSESIDIEQYADKHPEIADQLRHLYPAMQAMANLGFEPEATLSPAAANAPDDAEQYGTLGDFRLLREIGRGGMGVVYEARQISLSRNVALKILPFASMLDDRHIQRFKNEALAAAQLDHPHIVDVYGVGCERSVHYYAMRYVEGTTLAEVIHELRDKQSLEHGKAVPSHRGEDQRTQARPTGVRANDARPHSPPQAHIDTGALAAISTILSGDSRRFIHAAARIGIEVAEALDHAHEHGVIHRDIKPGNILLDHKAKTWVTDFGLARLETNASMTMTGDLLGTVRYMSPEQAMAKRVIVDHRTDIYSLGVTLYELVTLQPAFPDSDRQELLRKIAFEEPTPPRKLNRAIPEELETIILKASAKNPAERYATATDLAEDLRSFLDNKPIQAKRPTALQRMRKWSRRHQTLVWTSGIAAVVLLSLGMAALSISNTLVTQERNEKDEALSELTVALQEKSDALMSAKTNLQLASNERQRAEANLQLAMQALDEVYLNSIGVERLLADTARARTSTAHVPLTEQERQLLEQGMGFYDAFVVQNDDNPGAARHVARVYITMGNINMVLADRDRARGAYAAAVELLESLAEDARGASNYFYDLGRAYHALGDSVGWPPEAADKYGKASTALSSAVEQNPQDDRAYYYRARVHESLNQHEQALADHEQAIELAPEKVEYRYAFAGFLRLVRRPKLRDYDRALEEAKKALELAPRAAATHCLLAELYGSNFSDQERALVHANKAIELGPTHAKAYRVRGKVHVKRRQFEQALADFDKSIELAPSSMPYVDRGRLNARLNRDEQALSDYKAAEEFDPGCLYLYQSRCKLHLARKEYQAALADLNKALVLDPYEWWVYKRRAEVRFHLGQYDKALADISRAVELNPRDSSNVTWLGPSQIAQCPDQSLRDGIRTLADKSVQLTDSSSGALETRATLLAAFGDFEQALADLNAVIAREEATYYRHYQAALLALAINDPARYRETCQRMLKTFSETEKVRELVFTAWTCVLSRDSLTDYSTAIDLAKRATANDPRSPLAHRALAGLLLRAGDHQSALDALQQANSLGEVADASSAYTDYLLAMVHRHLEDTAQARAALEQANAAAELELTDEEHPAAWNRRLTLKLLRQQTETLIDESNAVKGDTKKRQE